MALSNDSLTSGAPTLAALEHLKWNNLYLREKPYQVFAAINDANAARSNLEFEKIERPIYDVRPSLSSLDLDTHGFVYAPFDIPPSATSSSDAIPNEYMPQAASMVRRLLKADLELVMLSWRVRRTWMPDGGIAQLNDMSSHILPSYQAHTDIAASTVPSLVRKRCGERANELLKGRVRLINVWKPLVDAVYDNPLAICDRRTVSPADFVDADHITRKAFEQNCWVLHNDRHRWYYLDRQRHSEALIFKNFDSDTSVASTRCPHSSFKHTGYSMEEHPGRESIELRMIVFGG